MSRWPERLQRALATALTDTVPREHVEPHGAVLRRRAVVCLTLVVGATLLGLSLSARAGARSFYWLTTALAVTWILGGLASGPLHLGRIRARSALRRPVLSPVVLGLAAAAVFITGALVIREIEPLRTLTEDVLAHARRGSFVLVLIIAVVNGIAEEIFFRGALFAAVGRSHPVAISTAVYTLTTLATGNPVLTFAAATLGTVWGLQRRASGGILAPMLTHVTWSSAMLVALPPLFS